MGRHVHTDTIIMVRTTECMISTIYIVVKINKYKIKFSLTNNVIAFAIAVGGVVVSSIVAGGSGASVTAVDVSTGAAVAANDNNNVGAVLPPSSTKDKDVYVGASVAFEGACVGTFADSDSESTAVSVLLPPRCQHRAVRRRHASRCHQSR